MPRTREDARVLWRCVEPFAVFRGRHPVVFGQDDEVLDDDPILRTHRAHFEPAADRLLRRTTVEMRPASPLPRSAAVITTDPEEPLNG